jgi:hypothetical protein
MTSEQKIAWSVVAVVVVGFAVLMLLPAVEERLAPEPRAAWVAVEVNGGGVAEVAPVEIAAGAPFRLYAVLEAADRDGEPVYYTEAPALVIGGAPVPAAALRRWDRPQPIKVLWFTVEGTSPFLGLEAGEDLGRFRIEPFFRSDWGIGWTVPGRLDPAHDDRLTAADRPPEVPFGTQRYQVRVELYSAEGSGLVPEARFSSPGPAPVAEMATAQGEAAAAPQPLRVTATLPGPAAPASAVFGLTGIEPPPDASPELQATLLAWTRERLAFGRVAVLATILEAAGRSSGDLDWRQIELDGGETWSELTAGDLLRVGDRVVVLWRDAGEPGVLDRGDLCLDFVRGAAVRPLGEVFSEPLGDEGGLVEWARLTRPATGEDAAGKGGPRPAA